MNGEASWNSCNWFPYTSDPPVGMKESQAAKGRRGRG